MILHMNFSFIMSTVGLEFSFPKFEKINLMMSSGLPLSCSRTSDSVFTAHILLPCQIWCLRYPRCSLFLKSRNRSLRVMFQLAASGPLALLFDCAPPGLFFVLKLCRLQPELTPTRLTSLEAVSDCTQLPLKAQHALYALFTHL